MQEFYYQYITLFQSTIGPGIQGFTVASKEAATDRHCLIWHYNWGQASNT
jgi:hypothetical protein